jgi:peptide/nickel transport system permease protein
VTTPANDKPKDGRSRVRSVFRMIRKSKGMMAGLVIVSIFLVVATAVYLADLVGVMITPYDPIKNFIAAPLSAPSWAHPFGTDPLGRDVFSRIIAATPTDVGVSLAVIAVALFVGGTIGSYAAYNGGILDEALMRFTDVFFALPVLVLAIVIAVILGPGIINMMFVLMIIWWPTYARLARGETLKVIHQNFIEAARLSGQGRVSILSRHVLPNIAFILLVYATLDVGTVVLVFSGLSYLGLAVTPPSPDWGQMVNSYQDFLLSAPWLPLSPGLVIALGVIGFSVLGDGLRDILELR